MPRLASRMRLFGKLVAFLFLTPFSIPDLCHAKSAEVLIIHAANFSEQDSGYINPYNQDATNGMQLAIDDQTKKLKHHNIKIRLEKIDYGSSDMKALESANTIVQSQAVAVIGYYESNQALLAAPILNKNKVPYISPFSSARRLYNIGEYVHHMSFSNTDMGYAMARLASKKLMAKSALVITVADCAYCNDLSDAFQVAAKAEGITYKNIEVLSSDAQFPAVDRELKQTNFDVLVVPNYELISAKIVAYVMNRGVSRPFIGGDGWADASGKGILKIVNNRNFEGYCTSHWVESFDSEAGKDFERRYLTKYNKRPNNYSAAGYDSMTRVLIALLNTKIQSRAEMQMKLSELTSFKGVMGNYTIDRASRKPLKPIDILKANTGTGTFDPFWRVEQKK